jgi:hypothetical protein
VRKRRRRGSKKLAEKLFEVQTLARQKKEEEQREGKQKSITLRQENDKEEDD